MSNQVERSFLAEPRTLFNAAGGAAPAFSTDWLNLGAPYELLGVYRWGPLVHLSGLIKKVGAGVASEVIFTLPAGYRPDARIVESTLAGGADGRVDIHSNGECHWEGGDPTVYLSIDSIFRAA